jgi:hypothetical protein
VEVIGLGKSTLRPIAGEDSVQALVLALEFVTNVLPVEAQRARGQLEWLGERERLVFANTLSVGLASKALQNLVEGLACAVDVLQNGTGRRPVAAKQLARRLRALIASGGSHPIPPACLDRRTGRFSGPRLAVLASAAERQRWADQSGIRLRSCPRGFRRKQEVTADGR